MAFSLGTFPLCLPTCPPQMRVWDAEDRYTAQKGLNSVDPNLDNGQSTENHERKLPSEFGRGDLLAASDLMEGSQRRNVQCLCKDFCNLFIAKHWAPSACLNVGWIFVWSGGKTRARLDQKSPDVLSHAAAVRPRCRWEGALRSACTRSGDIGFLQRVSGAADGGHPAAPLLSQ